MCWVGYAAIPYDREAGVWYGSVPYETHIGWRLYPQINAVISKQQINSFYAILGTHTDGEMNVICLASYQTNMAAK